MSKELKPCPFCGGKARLCITGTWSSKHYHSVKCEKCYTVSYVYDTEKEARTAWNNRAK